MSEAAAGIFVAGSTSLPSIANPADGGSRSVSLSVSGGIFEECRNLTQFLAEFLLGGHRKLLFYFKPESRASASSFIMLTHSRSVISVLRSGTPMYERISSL